MKIYLIWGAPKSGKTTLSKVLAKKYDISYMSIDSIENILKYYLPKEDFAKNVLKWDSSKSNDEFYRMHDTEAIMNSYITQGKISYKAVRSLVETCLIDWESIILEGFQMSPELVHAIQKEFWSENIKEVFLVKTDKEKFLQDIHKSTTPSDWILEKTKEEDTFSLIADMLILYSKYFESEAEKYSLDILNMDEDFEEKIQSYK